MAAHLCVRSLLRGQWQTSGRGAEDGSSNLAELGISFLPLHIPSPGASNSNVRPTFCILRKDPDVSLYSVFAKVSPCHRMALRHIFIHARELCSDQQVHELHVIQKSDQSSPSDLRLASEHHFECKPLCSPPARWSSYPHVSATYSARSRVCCPL